MRTQSSEQNTSQPRIQTKASSFFTPLNYVQLYSDGIGFGRVTFRLSNVPKNLSTLYKGSTSSLWWLTSVVVSMGVKASEYSHYYFNDGDGNQGRLDLNKDTKVDFHGCLTTFPRSIEMGVLEALPGCNVTINSLTNVSYALVEQFYSYQHMDSYPTGGPSGGRDCRELDLTDYLAVFYSDLRNNFSEEFINCLRDIITENYDVASMQKLKENREIWTAMLIGGAVLVGCGVCFYVIRCMRGATCESNNCTGPTKEKQYEKVQDQDIAIEMKELKRENRLLKMQVEGISSEEKKLREKTKKKKEKILLLEEGEGEGERSSSEDEVPLLDPREVRTIEKLKEENKQLKKEKEKVEEQFVLVSRQFKDNLQLNEQKEIELRNKVQEVEQSKQETEKSKQETEKSKQETEKSKQETEKSKQETEKYKQALQVSEQGRKEALEKVQTKDAALEETSNKLAVTQDALGIEKYKREKADSTIVRLKFKNEYNHGKWRELARQVEDAISVEMIEDPVTLSTGQTYSRKEIAQWRSKSMNAQGYYEDPVAKKMINDDPDKLPINIMLKGIVAKIREFSYGDDVLDNDNGKEEKKSMDNFNVNAN